MPRDSRGVWCWPQGALTPLGILWPSEHDGQVRQILWPPSQSVWRSDTWRPYIYHALQCGLVRRHLSRRRARRGLSCWYRTWRNIFILTMDLLPWPNHRGSRGSLTFSQSTNTRDTMSMSSQPCHAPSRILVQAYERHTMGTGKLFWERQRSRLNFP